MPIEVSCFQCGALLRVGDEHAGKKARCPNCETVNSIPEAGEAAADAPYAQVGYGASQPGHPQQLQPPGFGAQGNYALPNRGGLIFALGLISLLICCIPGFFAFFMGREDLKKMKDGIMDPTGQGMTQAGMILGAISVTINALTLIGYTIFFGVMAANGNF